MRKPIRLLLIKLSMLKQQSLLRHNPRLPRQRANILRTQRIRKHAFDLLESLTRCFGKGEKDVDEHGEIEYPEDNVCFPFDVYEGRGDEVA